MSQDEKSSATCLIILIMVALLTMVGLLLLRRHVSSIRKLAAPESSHASRSVAVPSPPTIDAPRDNGMAKDKTWDLAAWSRKPVSQAPSFCVMPVIEKNKYGLELSLAF